MTTRTTDVCCRCSVGNVRRFQGPNGHAPPRIGALLVEETEGSSASCQEASGMQHKGRTRACKARNPEVDRPAVAFSRGEGTVV